MKPIVTYLILTAFIFYSCNKENDQVVDAHIYDLYVSAQENAGIDNEKALSEITQALTIIENDGKESVYSVYLLNLRGFIFQLQKNYTQSISSFEEAIALNKGDQFQLAYSHYQIGVSFRLFEIPEQAISSLQEALSLFSEQKNQEWQYKCNFNLAMSWYHLGNNVKAELGLKKALFFAESLNLSQGIIASMIELSQVYINMGEVSLATQLIHDVENRFGAALGLQDKLRVLKKKAACEIANNNTEKAINLFDSAMELIRENREAIPARIIFRTIQDYGEVVRATGQTNKAISVWEEADDLINAPEQQYYESRYVIYRGLTMAYTQTGNEAAALAYANKANALLEPYSRLKSELEERHALATYRLQQKENEMALAASRHEARQQSILQAGMIGLLALCLLVIGRELYMRRKRKRLQAALAESRSDRAELASSGMQLLEVIQHAQSNIEQLRGPGSVPLDKEALAQVRARLYHLSQSSR